MQNCEEFFDKLKYLLTIALVLKIPDFDKDFAVCIDAFVRWD